ncbi:MAG TPA: hypothetical protein HPP83_01350 [Candidatus Hydrogenedentes bacterium]|nr:hypothetical protein [Candidatus Hydrogenedentota bacterium]
MIEKTGTPLFKPTDMLISVARMYGDWLNLYRLACIPSVTHKCHAATFASP